jgi:hypothetical protein
MDLAAALEYHRMKAEFSSRVARAVAAEREACAKIADDLHVFKDEFSVCALITAKIRERNKFLTSTALCSNL